MAKTIRNCLTLKQRFQLSKAMNKSEIRANVFNVDDPFATTVEYCINNEYYLIRATMCSHYAQGNDYRFTLLHEGALSSFPQKYDSRYHENSQKLAKSLFILMYKKYTKQRNK